MAADVLGVSSVYDEGHTYYSNLKLQTIFLNEK